MDNRYLDASLNLYAMQILRPRCDGRILVTFYYVPALDDSFLLTILELVSRVGCGVEANGKQAETWLTIPPPVF